MRKANSVWLCAAAFGALVFSTAAGAHGGPGLGFRFGPGFGFGGFGHGLFSGGPFGMGLGHRGNNNQCARDCAQAARDCNDAARVTAHLCVQTTCTSEAQAVRDACASDPTSDSCHTARSALGQCRQPCITAYQSSSQACRANRKTCVTACPAVVPKDPQCVATCIQTSQSCVSTATGQAEACRVACNDLVTTASQACAAATNQTAASTCVSAWQAALACLQPCNQTLSTALKSCAQGASTCTDACPTASPAATPTPTPSS